MQRLLCNENSTTGSREGRRKRSSGHTRYLPACLPRLLRLLGLLRRITYLADITGEENETAKRNGRHLLLLVVVVVSVPFLFLFESQRFVFCSHIRKRSFLSRQCVCVCVCVFLFFFLLQDKAGELSHRLRMATGGSEEDNGDSTDEDSFDDNDNQRRRYRNEEGEEEEGQVAATAAAAAVLEDRHVRSMAALAEMEVGDDALSYIPTCMQYDGDAMPSLCSVPCALCYAMLYILRCALCSVLCALCSVLSALCSVPYAVL